MAEINIEKMAQNVDDAIQESIDTIEALSNVTPQPKTGHWIEDENEMKVWCSICGEENDWCLRYCPNCGCRMVEPMEKVLSGGKE